MPNDECLMTNEKTQFVIRHLIISPATMTWRNVRLIYGREIRDQLRDRRTLFMIAVLPLLLYPLLGMSVFQLSQFLRKSEPRVLVIGSEQVAESKDLPPLFVDGHFATALFDDPAEAMRLQLEFVPGANSDRIVEAAADRLKTGEVQVVLRFPPDFGDRLKELREQIKARVGNGKSAGDRNADAAAEPVAIPEPQLIYNSGKEKSGVAHVQVSHALDTWKSQIIRENLLASRVPPNVAKPFELAPHDVAEHRQHQALMWSKILPFVLFIWALTGAFYPAVDLCAGEKERGTLETLLSSPARRIEIVLGKLFTVMTFSVATATLNLVSLGFTARYIVAQLRALPTGDMAEGLDLPPLVSAMWLLMALLPMSALFSALCLACAAFARSTKEGQYYLMPLLLVTMPLMMLPMAPGSELNLGNSLIPVTGVVLLLMALMQGNYAEVIRYVVPVVGITLICCYWAIRWAVFQFNQESVLFRESERLDLRRWIAHVVRDRKETPSLPEAFFCVALIYVIQFFTSLAISANTPATPSFRYVVMLLFISQVVCIALPAVLMALLFTENPRKTLLLDRAPRLAACGVAVLLALLLHPVGLQLAHAIRQLYPIQAEVLTDLEAFANLLKTAPYPWLPFLLMALLPALCEELAFRGFVLSGLRHLGSKSWAIGLSAVFFGIAHGVIQQSLAAATIGLVLGYLAIQTGSLIPCILFHLSYNGLMFGSAKLTEISRDWPQWAVPFYEPSPGEIVYRWPVVAVCGLLSLLPLWWLHRLPYQATREEQINEARARQPHHPLAASVPGNAE
jgi:sodium transport system permease protein